jgi:hypothetical protein
MFTLHFNIILLIYVIGCRMPCGVQPVRFASQALSIWLSYRRTTDQSL